MENIGEKRLPEWLRKPMGSSHAIHVLKRDLRARGLHTVCEEAHCPNLGECFARGTATIMIMGDRCTRACRFCAIKGGKPAPLDAEEPRRVARQVKEMGLKHAVITSVTRDDLSDGGAAHFAETVIAVRKECPETTVEVLTPDFEGRVVDVETVCRAKPAVYNHNVETVERLTPEVRDPRASYRRSLELLSRARERQTEQSMVKSGFMVGFGEEDEEIEQTLSDLARAGCDIVTIGQYLAPSRKAAAVVQYVRPEKFREYEEIGLKHGIKHMFCGPLVRSSYLADKVLL